MLLFTYCAVFFYARVGIKLFSNCFMSIHVILNQEVWPGWAWHVGKGEKMQTKTLYKGNLKVLSALRQGYANTEESLGNSVLLLSDMSEVAGASSFPAEAKLKAALRLLFTKQPA